MEINSYFHKTATPGREIYGQIQGWNFETKSVLQTTIFLLCKRNNSEGPPASTKALKKQRKWTWVDAQQPGGKAIGKKKNKPYMHLMDIHLREKRLCDGSKRFNIHPDAPPRRQCTVQSCGPGRRRVTASKQACWPVTHAQMTLAR